MDLYGIDLNLLVAFDALMSERSVTKAGKRIGRTQPAVSAALARLRTLLDDELFVRGKNNLQPTQRAVDLAGPIGKALHDLGQTLGFAQAFDPSTTTIALNVAMQEHAAFKLLPGLLHRINREAPTAQLHIVTYRARDDAIVLLDSGEADVAVGVPASHAPGRIFVHPLFEEPFVCVVRKGHPIAGKALDLETYLQLDHLLVSPEGDRFGHTDTRLAKDGLKRRLALTISQMYPAPALVAGSDLIATLMRGVIEVGGWRERLQVFEPPIALDSCPYVMSWHRRNDAHPAQRWLRTCIESVSIADEPIVTTT